MIKLVVGCAGADAGLVGFLRKVLGPEHVAGFRSGFCVAVGSSLLSLNVSIHNSFRQSANVGWVPVLWQAPCWVLPTQRWVNSMKLTLLEQPAQQKR